MKKFYQSPKAFPEVITDDMSAEIVFVPPAGASFLKKLLCYIGIWLCVILVAVGVMWSIMTQYEAALPSTAMDEYLLSSRQDMFYFAISNIFNSIDNRFEKPYDVASNLAKEYAGTLTYNKLSTEYTQNNPVYIIKHNGENLFKVTLEEGDKTGFMNFSDYQLKSIELVKSDIFSFKSYKIVFASNMLVNINGISLGTTLADFEAVDLFGADGYYGITVDNFSYEPEIVALSYLYENSADSVVIAKRVGDYYIFERENEEFYTVTVTVPSGAAVAIDGKAVSSSFITEQYVAEDGTEMSVYTIPTVFTAETIAATLGGKPLELTQDGFNFSASVTGEECTVTVPHGAKLFVNGKEVSDSYITNTSAIWHSDFDEIDDYPTATEYTLYAYAESLTATLDGKELTAYTDGEKTVFTEAESEDLAKAYSDSATEFVHQYLYYSTQGYRNTDQNLADTLALVAPSSPLRSYLKLANVGIEYKTPQTMSVEYITADSFIPYGDGAFVCNVSYKATLNNSVSEVVEENVIHLIFIKSNGKFLPAKFIL